MTPQETHAAVVSLLQQQGLPLSTANLNRGMMALAQNDMSTEGAALPAVNASIDRTMGAAQQAASPPLPTPPIPPTTVPQQQQPIASAEPAAPSQMLNLYTGDEPVMPDGSASSTVAAPAPVQPTAQPFSYNSMMEDIRNGRVPNPAPDLPLISFGTGPVSAPSRAYPAMQQFMRQRTMDAMRQNPPRPPSNMLNQAGDGFEDALAARTQAGQRSSYNGEAVDNFIKGGNTPSASSSAPSSSVKTNTPTWKGESDPSAPMGARSTATPTQSTPAQKQNTATPHTPSQDTSGAGSAIKQSLTKRKQMAASKSTRKSKD